MKVQCNNEPGKKASSNSYMGVIASGELEKNKVVIFSYSRSRSAEVAQKLLTGYNRILVTDGYAVYNNLENELNHAECWAHATWYWFGEDIENIDYNKFERVINSYKQKELAENEVMQSLNEIKYKTIQSY